MTLFPLKKIFGSRAAPGSETPGPETMETHRVPADAGQTMDYVSCKAEKNWRGKWRVYFCDYLPADTAEARAKSANRKLEKAACTLEVRGAKTRIFRVMRTLCLKKGLSRREALSFLQEQDAEWAQQGLIPDRVKNAPHPGHWSCHQPATPEKPAANSKPGAATPVP
jgi:hypothetical protein